MLNIALAVRLSAGVIGFSLILKFTVRYVMGETNICHLEADVVKRTSSGARLLFSFKGFRLI